MRIVDAANRIRHLFPGRLDSEIFEFKPDGNATVFDVDLCDSVTPQIVELIQRQHAMTHEVPYMPRQWMPCLLDHDHRFRNECEAERRLKLIGWESVQWGKAGLKLDITVCFGLVPELIEILEQSAISLGDA